MGLHQLSNKRPNPFTRVSPAHWVRVPIIDTYVWYGLRKFIRKTFFYLLDFLKFNYFIKLIKNKFQTECAIKEELKWADLGGIMWNCSNIFGRKCRFVLAITGSLPSFAKCTKNYSALFALSLLCTFAVFLCFPFGSPPLLDFHCFLSPSAILSFHKKEQSFWALSFSLFGSVCFNLEGRRPVFYYTIRWNLFSDSLQCNIYLFLFLYYLYLSVLTFLFYRSNYPRFSHYQVVF